MSTAHGWPAHANIAPRRERTARIRYRCGIFVDCSSMEHISPAPMALHTLAGTEDLDAG